MNESRHSNTFDGVHLVRLSEATQAAYATDSLRLRPFGIAEPDLRVDFNQPSVPALVTDILECCATAGNGKAPERNLIWDLQVGTRIECLLRIVSLSSAFAVAFVNRCRNEDCGQELEVELSLDDLLSLRDETGDFVTVQCADETLVVRKPTGADQREWAARGFRDESDAAERMIETLIVRDDARPPEDQSFRFPHQLVRLVDQALQAADSLVDFGLALICPYCESSSEFEVDLQALALQRLEQCQRRLLNAVHTLAKNYHWSEQEIFAVPAWRRNHYLRMLEAEE